MKSVLLRLEGPLQAWATQSKLGVRDTDHEPSKSGVLGLVAAALGVERHDESALAGLATLKLAVRVDRPGSLLRDYHTAGGGVFRHLKDDKYRVFGTKGCVPSQRFLLQDASFVAALSGEDELIDRIGRALQAPRWPLFLGRRACPPSVPVFMGFANTDARSAVRGAPVCSRAEKGSLRVVVEAGPGEEGDARYDVPLSFREGARRYAVRYVKNEWLPWDEANAITEGVE